MGFKIGDKVIVTTPSWHEECIVIKMGFSDNVMFVQRANGTTPAIFKSWASLPKPKKNEQLLFNFMRD